MTGQILIQFPLLCHVLHLSHSRISIRAAMHMQRKKEREREGEKKKKKKKKERKSFRRRDTSAIIIPQQIIIPAIKRHLGRGEGEEEAEGKASSTATTAKCPA